MNTKGQSSLEGLIVLPIGIVATCLLFWSVAVGWAFLWTQYQLSEATICLQDQNVYECEKKFLEKMKGLMTYVRITHLQALRHPEENKMRCELLISFFGVQTIEMEKSIPR